MQNQFNPDAVRDVYEAHEKSNRWPSTLGRVFWLLFPGLICGLSQGVHEKLGLNAYRGLISWQYNATLLALATQPIFLRFFGNFVTWKNEWVWFTMIGSTIVLAQLETGFNYCIGPDLSILLFSEINLMTCIIAIIVLIIYLYRRDTVVWGDQLFSSASSTSSTVHSRNNVIVTDVDESNLTEDDIHAFERAASSSELGGGEEEIKSVFPSGTNDPFVPIAPAVSVLISSSRSSLEPSLDAALASSVDGNSEVGTTGAKGGNGNPPMGRGSFFRNHGLGIVICQETGEIKVLSQLKPIPRCIWLAVLTLPLLHILIYSLSLTNLFYLSNNVTMGLVCGSLVLEVIILRRILHEHTHITNEMERRRNATTKAWSRREVALSVIPALSLILLFAIGVYCSWLASTKNPLMLLLHLPISYLFEEFVEHSVELTSRPFLFARLCFLAQVNTYLPQYVLLDQVGWSINFVLLTTASSLHSMLMAAQVYQTIREKLWSLLTGKSKMNEPQWTQALRHEYNMRMFEQACVAELWSIFTVACAASISSLVYQESVFFNDLEWSLSLGYQFLFLLLLKVSAWFFGYQIIKWKIGPTRPQSAQDTQLLIDTLRHEHDPVTYSEALICLSIDYPHIGRSSSSAYHPNSLELNSMESEWGYWRLWIGPHAMAAVVFVLFSVLSGQDRPTRYAFS
jgi:hypothetical protein